ncbi:MAG: M23 family metallopeptidase [Acidobacteria bacterium]|nr:M23 family metallopeptidase [Acidobacteriota bacterium]
MLRVHGVHAAHEMPGVRGALPQPIAPAPRPRAFLPAVLLAAATAAAAGAAPITVTTDARSIRPGELVVFTIGVPDGTDHVTVRAFDRDVPATRLDNGAWRALVGIDVGVRPRRYRVEISAEGGDGPAATLSYPLPVASRTFPTRRLRVDPDFVNPPAGQLDRILREAKELNGLWERAAEAPWRTGPFVRPVPGPANSAFGTRSIFNGEERSRHSGGDFRAATGTPVRAPGGGRVALADDLYFSGRTVVIDHGLGLFSLLAHLSEIDVTAGDVIEAGDTVGRTGATGRVTGPHLHWAVRVNGARVDPLSVLAVLGPAR